MTTTAPRAFWALSLVVVACGGSDEGGLFGTGGDSAGAAGVAAGGAGGAASGGSAGSASGGASSGGAAGTGGVGAAGGSGGGGGNLGGAGGAPVGGGGSGGSGASGGGTPGVGTGPCGAYTCAFGAGDTCCKGDNVPLYCANEKLSNPCKCSGIACDKLSLACDGPEDCPSGKLCCAEKSLVSGSWDVVECRATCVSDRVGATRREVCHPAGKPCASGTACTADPALPPGYATCAPQ